VSSIIGLAAVFGFGYGFADYRLQVECTFDKMKLQQEYSEKVQGAVENCRNLKIQEYQQSLDELKLIVTDLAKRKNGK
jgi:hypothetical protein